MPQYLDDIRHINFGMVSGLIPRVPDFVYQLWDFKNPCRWSSFPQKLAVSDSNHQLYNRWRFARTAYDTSARMDYVHIYIQYFITMDYRSARYTE